MKLNKKNNIIYVIDSPIIAVMAAIANEGHCIRGILEIKDGISIGPMVRAILGNHELRLEEISVPSKYFVGAAGTVASRIGALKSFYKEILSVFEIDPTALYVGPSCSSLMACIPHAQRYYLDHGAGDYLRRFQRTSPRAKVVAAIKTFFDLKLGFPTLAIPHYVPGATLAKLKGDHYTHLDYADYQPTIQVKNILSAVSEHVRKVENVALVLPTTTWHSAAGFAGDATEYDELNIELVARYCTKDELLLIKYHPVLYAAREIRKNYTAKLEALGFNAIDIDDMVDAKYRGNIPAELLIQACNVTKIVCEQSSLLYNLAHKESPRLIADTGIFNDRLKRNGVVNSHFDTLNDKLCRMIEVYQ